MLTVTRRSVSVKYEAENVGVKYNDICNIWSIFGDIPAGLYFFLTLAAFEFRSMSSEDSLKAYVSLKIV